MPIATGTRGNTLDSGAPVVVSYVYGDAAPIDGVFFVADRAYRVHKILGRSTIAGTDGGAVTAAVKKAPSATGMSGGTALHASTIDLKTTADTNFSAITLTTTTADLNLAAGDGLGIDVTGTTTAARGCITVILYPLS